MQSPATMYFVAFHCYITVNIHQPCALQGYKTLLVTETHTYPSSRQLTCTDSRVLHLKLFSWSCSAQNVTSTIVPCLYSCFKYIWTVCFTFTVYYKFPERIRIYNARFYVVRFTCVRARRDSPQVRTGSSQGVDLGLK